jgi:hypothetical protein
MAIAQIRFPIHRRPRLRCQVFFVGQLPGAVGVGGCGLGLAEQVAELEEMLLGRRAFREVGPLLLGDELLRELCASVERRATRIRVDDVVILLLAQQPGQRDSERVIVARLGFL